MLIPLNQPTPHPPTDLTPCHRHRPVTCYLCEHERAIKPYGLEVSKTLRKASRDSLGLSLNLVSGAFYIYGHCHYIRGYSHIYLAI